MNTETKLQRLIENLEGTSAPAIVGAGPPSKPVAADLWFERRIAGEFEFDYRGPRGRRERASVPHTFVVAVVADGALTASINAMRVRLGGVLYDTPPVELPVGALSRASHVVIEFSQPTSLRLVPLLAAGDDPDAGEPVPEWADAARVKVSVALPLEMELPTPIVNVAPPEINVEMPELQIDVHVPEQPAPIAAAAPSQVVAVKVETDRKGQKTYRAIYEEEA